MLDFQYMGGVSDHVLHVHIIVFGTRHLWNVCEISYSRVIEYDALSAKSCLRNMLGFRYMGGTRMGLRSCTCTTV